MDSIVGEVSDNCAYSRRAFVLAKRELDEYVDQKEKP
eukprot:XP_001704722.1 Hypothetical protein GL50803_34450 [Giardia lamblia ATCC 50803]